MKHWMVLGLMAVLARPALADPTADARGVEEAFAHACSAGDLKGVMALYADDAIAVWPGQGAEANGDAHIVTVAHWESTLAGPGRRRLTTEVRSTEVLVKKDGAWRYLVDHASIGQPRPRQAAAARRARRMR